MESLLFTREDLKKLIVPLIIEQALALSIGLFDTLMVSSCGEAAVSGVSLVDSISTLLIQILSALATGGAVVCSQYIGKKMPERAKLSAGQLMFIMLMSAGTVMVVILLSYRFLLRAIFGQIDADVMQNAEIYFIISAISYPFLGVYNAGAALFRAIGNSKVSMYTSLVMNVINIGGNAVLIFGLKMGVLGAALATLTARIVSALVMVVLLSRKDNPLCIATPGCMKPQRDVIGKILKIGIPSGVENGMFQFGKLAIQSTVSLMGTAAIAAQGMTNIIENLNGIMSIGMGIGLMTVVGECLGAGEKEEAVYYIKKISIAAEVVLIATCLLMFGLTYPITYFGGMEPESAKLCIFMVTCITIVKPIVWIMAFIPPYGFRAAGDVRFTMTTSMLCMWLCRVVLAMVLARVFHMGPIAVWIGMFTDWTIRGIIYTIRFKNRKWLAHQVI